MTPERNFARFNGEIKKPSVLTNLSLLFLKSIGFFSITFSLTKKSKKALRYTRRRLKVAGLISSEKYLRMEVLNSFSERRAWGKRLKKVEI